MCLVCIWEFHSRHHYRRIKTNFSRWKTACSMSILQNLGEYGFTGTNLPFTEDRTYRLTKSFLHLETGGGRRVLIPGCGSFLCMKPVWSYFGKHGLQERVALLALAFWVGTVLRKHLPVIYFFQWLGFACTWSSVEKITAYSEEGKSSSSTLSSLGFQVDRWDAEGAGLRVVTKPLPSQSGEADGVDYIGNGMEDITWMLPFLPLLLSRNVYLSVFGSCRFVLPGYFLGPSCLP